MKHFLILLLTFTFLSLLFTGCGAPTEEETDELVDFYDTLDPAERPADILNNAEAFHSRLLQSAQSDSLSFELPSPTDFVTLQINRVSVFEYDQTRIVEGGLSEPHRGFFEFTVHETYFEGIIQSANPLAAYRITYNPDTESHQIRRIMDDDYLEGAQPLTPPDL